MFVLAHVTPSCYIKYERITSVCAAKCVEKCVQLSVWKLWSFGDGSTGWVKAELGPLLGAAPGALAAEVLHPSSREAMFARGTRKDHPPPLPSGKKTAAAFLKGCCHHPRVDNNNSECKCKLGRGETLSARLHV